jgi:hypothetical protein
MTPPVVRIPLSQGRCAYVDAADAPCVRQYGWYSHRDRSGHWYARRQESYGSVRATPHGRRRRQRTILLHRFLLGRTPGDKRLSDHRDSDGLRCTRQNLRIANPSQNQANRPRQRSRCNYSQYKGVTRSTSGKPWQACIGDRYLGRFDMEIEAALAYNAAALARYGEFARLNEVGGERRKAA